MLAFILGNGAGSLDRITASIFWVQETKKQAELLEIQQ